MSKTYVGEQGLKELLNDERKDLVESWWALYKESGDPECLAKICEAMPFFENPEVGQEISKFLRKRPRTKGFEYADDKRRILRYWDDWQPLPDGVTEKKLREIISSYMNGRYTPEAIRDIIDKSRKNS